MTAQRREEREDWYRANISSWSNEDLRDELAITQRIAAGKTASPAMKEAYCGFAGILQTELRYRQTFSSPDKPPLTPTLMPANSPR